MSKSILTISILICIVTTTLQVSGQNSYDKDTLKVMELVNLAQKYRFSKPDSSLPLGQEALALARSVGFRHGEAEALLAIGEFHRVSGNFPQSLEHLFPALRIGREINDSAIQGGALTFIGTSYIAMDEYRTALDHLFQAYEINRRLPINNVTGFSLSNIGLAYYQMNMLDSALIYQRRAWQLAQHITLTAGKAYVLRELGNVHRSLHNFDSAMYYYRFALGISKDVLNIGRIYTQLGKLFIQINQPDSALYYSRFALVHGVNSRQKTIMLEASNMLSAYYLDRKQLDSAVKYQQLTMALNDSLFGSKQVRKLQLFAISEQNRIHDAERKQLLSEQAEASLRNRIKMFALVTALVVFLFFGLTFFRNSKRMRRANKLLETQKNETEKTLTELRAAQKQLIQSEKMASLGELTAGIAHEIQNPLNFVNNFSELNTELIDEMRQELANGNLEEAKIIANDIKNNEQKINHHGKRADSIVKGMLQHSRNNSGQKEPTDINALVDECMRLSYHGLRAKDKSFNAKTETDLDDSIPKLNIASQDVGRVILNLFTNAFYAVMQKKKQLGDAFEPIVSVKTRNLNGSIEITIHDNGNGVSQNIADKIFQPFFTTKPVGEGTGLGLSMSYDIITKGHGGQLSMRSQEGEFAEFIIVLPYNQTSSR